MTFQMDTTMVLRLRHEEKQAIDRVVKEKSDLYENPSHFVRCAIIHFLTEHGITVKMRRE